MRINGFYIDGFGLYHHQGVPDLSPGLAVFLGENESGKTTLMEFLRTVLFGFPRRGTRNLYPPLSGGNHGGRLQLIRQDGRRFTIERLDRHATIAEEGRAPEKADPAALLLGGLDRKTFERVFAIGLDDLQKLDVLSQEGVRGRLFSAGAGLGATSVPAALKNLDEELKELLSQRGQQRINKIVHQLKELDSQINNLKGQAAEFAAGQRRREQLEARIRRHRGEAEKVHQKLSWLAHLQKAREPWVKRGLAQEKAAALKFARDFPPNGLERFETFKKNLDKLRLDQRAKQEEARLLEQRLSRLTVDEALVSQQEAIEALLGEKTSLAEALNDYPAVKSKRDQAEEECRRRLLDLGTDWDAARLAQVDTSVQTRQQVKEMGRRLEAAAQKHEQAQAQQRNFKEAETEAKLRCEQARQEWQESAVPPVTDESRLQEKQDAVRRLRLALYQRDLLTAHLKAGLTAQQDTAARLLSLARQMEAPAALLPGWLGIAVLTAGVAAAGVLAWQRAYVSAGVAALAGLGAAAFLFFFRRRQRDLETGRLANLTEDQQQVEQAEKTLREEIGHLEKQLEAGDQEIARLALQLGVQNLGDLAQLEQLAGEVEDAAGQLREWQARERETAKLEAQWHALQDKLAKAGLNTEEAFKELQRLTDDWQGWTAQRGFSDKIRPGVFELVLKAVEHALSAQDNLKEYRRRLGQMESYLEEVRARLEQVLTACGRAPLAGQAGVQDLEALRLALQANLELKQRHRDLAGKFAAAQTDLKRLEEEKNHQESELSALLHQAGASNEEEFRRVAQAHEDWRAGVQEVQAYEGTLRTLAGTPEAQAALEAELGQADPLELQAEKGRLEAKLAEVTEAISHDDREDAVLKEKLTLMAQDEKLGELLLEQRSLKEQLAAATQRWATLVVCRHLLEQARGVYERERQPQVIKEAGIFLNTMTRGRYKLVSSVGENSIQLEDTSLKRKDETSWSAGLADQVYLAIRLGLAREFGRHTEPLPVILDDVLVKFDPRRRRGAAEVILGFCRSQQVLMFSCHPEFKEIIEQVRREPRYHETPVSYYTITDGVIEKG